MNAVQVRFAREFGWLMVCDPWGDWHEIAVADSPKWMVREAMDHKKSQRMIREGKRAA